MNLDKLNAVLTEGGYLGKAVVLNARLVPVETNGLSAEFLRLTLELSSNDHSLPDRMFVKRSKLTDRGQGEANVYTRILRDAQDLPTMTCYGIVDDDPDTGLNFLFEDLSDSHAQTSWPIIPGLADCEGAVTALAHIHANWWGRTQAIPDVFSPVTPQQNPAHLTGYFSAFVDFVGESLSPRRRAAYERVFADLDALLERRLNTGNATLLHNDPHFWNFLYANSGQPDECVIFDWPLWRTGLAGSDLAYMIALHLYPEHRRRFEAPMLDRYWHTLTAHGVAYDRDDVQFDYRIGIIIGLLMPILEFSWKIVAYDWLPKLEKAFAAFDDWHCGELLRAG